MELTELDEALGKEESEWREVFALAERTWAREITAETREPALSVRRRLQGRQLAHGYVLQDANETSNYV